MIVNSITNQMPTMYGYSLRPDFTHRNIEDLSTCPQRDDLSELEEFWYEDTEPLTFDELIFS